MWIALVDIKKSKSLSVHLANIRYSILFFVGKKRKHRKKKIEVKIANIYAAKPRFANIYISQSIHFWTFELQKFISHSFVSTMPLMYPDI